MSTVRSLILLTKSKIQLERNVIQRNSANRTRWDAEIVRVCLPIESTLRSTLICLYHRTWLDRISLRQLVVQPLKTSMNKGFSRNSNVEQIATLAFIEKWLGEVSYERFFSEYEPSFWQYSQSTHPDVLYIIIAFLGIYGGLSTALRFLLPLLVNIFYKIVQRNHSAVTPFER